MKTFNRIISLLMVALMLVTTVPYSGFSVVAAGGETENYSLTLEITPVDSFTAENSAEGMMSFFGSGEFDGCYGNQLSGVARELYDSLVKNYVEDKITGEYNYVFKTPFTFNAAVSGGSIVMNDELEEISLELHCAVQAAMDAFLYDHPEVFWLKIIGSSYDISASGNSVIGYTGIIGEITITPTEIYGGASSKLSQYASSVESVLGEITVTESRYETLKSIHDYICENAWYNLVSEQRVHSCEPFFIGDGGVVCEGYAKAFKVLCDRLDIPCVLVSGDAGGAHMWNYVQMDDGKWYLVDATWDDQDSQIYDTYFLANSSTIGFDKITISEERTERTDFSGTGIFSFTYPELSVTAYTPHVHEWDSEYTVDVEPTCTEKGSKSIHCKSCDETKSVTEIPAMHIDKNEDYLCDYCSNSLPVESGNCGIKEWSEEQNDEIPGDSVKYILYADGTLEIFGEGEIGSRAFYKNDNIKKLIVKNGITVIGSEAFDECDYLECVVLPSSVQIIEEAAFYHCNKLAKIEFAKGLKKLKSCSFQNCVNLEKIVLPVGLETVEAYAFAGCEKLEAVTFPESITCIGKSAFIGCSKLKEIKIPEGIKSIDDYTFHGCSSLEDMVIPESVTSIGDCAFYNCSSLKSIIIPGTVESIGEGAFAVCTGITELEICNGVKIIEESAFDRCEKLKSITIPESIEFIGVTSFDSCLSLTIIHYFGTKEQWESLINTGEHSLYRFNSRIHYCINKDEVAASCIAGNREGLFCEICNTYLYGGETIPAITEHQYSLRAGCSATCTQNGEKIYVCDICETATYREIIPATGKHSFTACMGEDSTCTEDGFIEYCCEICETETYRETLYAKGHKGGTATCKSKAECTVCGEEYGSLNKNNHKSVVTLKATASTCTKTGLTEGKKCKDCGKITLAQKTVAKKAHTYETTTTKATLSKNGKAVTKCTVCGTVAKTTTVYYPKTIKLSVASYTYNGKTKTPSVTVKDSKGKTLKNGTDYTVTYPKRRKSIGKYTVTVTFKGNYSGTKKLNFEIVPAKTTLSDLTAGSKRLTATWKTLSGVTGYEVQYSTSNKFTKKTTKTVTVKGSKSRKTTIKKLTKGKKYYVKVRAYKTVGKTKLYGAWSRVKNVKVR